MVAMGRALMMEPSVLLLDEPSAGLSPVMQDEVFVQTRRINRAGVSVVMVEQNARRCLQICDRGYVLDQGRNAYTGTGEAAGQGPEGHRALPRHPGQGLTAARPRRSSSEHAEGPGPCRSGALCRRVRWSAQSTLTRTTPETESICLYLLPVAVLAGCRWSPCVEATGVVEVDRTATCRRSRCPRRPRAASAHSSNVVHSVPSSETSMIFDGDGLTGVVAGRDRRERRSGSTAS